MIFVKINKNFRKWLLLLLMNILRKQEADIPTPKIFSVWVPVCECPDPRGVGHLPDQEVSDGEERVEDHDGEREHEPQGQQGDHRDGYWENKVRSNFNEQS